MIEANYNIEDSSIYKGDWLPTFKVFNFHPFKKRIIGLYKVNTFYEFNSDNNESVFSQFKFIYNLIYEFITKKGLRISFILKKDRRVEKTTIFLLVMRDCYLKKCIDETKILTYKLMSALKIYGFNFENRKTVKLREFKEIAFKKRSLFMYYYNFVLVDQPNLEESLTGFINEYTVEKNLPFLNDILLSFQDLYDIELFVSIQPSKRFFLSSIQKHKDGNGEKPKIILTLGVFYNNKKNKGKIIDDFIKIINSSIVITDNYKFRCKKISGKSMYGILSSKVFLLPTNYVYLKDIVIILGRLFEIINVLGDSKKLLNAGFDIIKERTKGDIFVGKQILRGNIEVPFFLKVDDIIRHVAIIGPSGKGKTSLAIQIIKEIAKKGLGNVWIFDFHGEYTFLSKYGFIIIRPTSIINPLAINMFDIISHGESTLQYSNFLSRLFLEVFKKQDYEISPQMERMLREAITKTVTSPLEYLRNPIGFIKNLVEWYNKASSIGFISPIATLHAIINRINSLFSGPMGGVLWVLETNIDFQYLLGKNVIFDLSPLTRSGVLKVDLIILINVILRLLYGYIIKLNKKINKRLFLVIEEARYIVPWRMRKSTADTTALEDYAILARKYGLSLITIAQSFKAISEDILENVGTIFFFGSEDIRDIKKLDNEEIGNNYDLPPKYAIVQLSEIPARTLVKINDIQLEKLSINNEHPMDLKGLSNSNVSDRGRYEYKPILISLDNLVSEFEGLSDSQEMTEKAIKLVELINKIYDVEECKGEYKFIRNFIVNFLLNYDLLKVDEIKFLLQRIRDNPQSLLISSDDTFIIKNLIKQMGFKKCVKDFFINILKTFGLVKNKIFEYELDDIISNIIRIYEDYFDSLST